MSALQETFEVQLPDIDRPPGTAVVGLSGGVDSSVTAALLQQAGFHVVGMTMQIWHRSSAASDETASAGCCTVNAVDDARQVARTLGIRYYVPNFREPFSVVVDDFAREYAAGRTPNPCVRCNQHVRFSGLIRKADELGAEYVATGHYARVSFDAIRNEYVLLKARDRAKDQSYVLHTLGQGELSRLITPLGGLQKRETRILAKKLGLEVASKPDSQEICFVGKGDYRTFLRQVKGVKSTQGPIVNRQGAVLGEHSGIEHYTVGQRKGLHLSGPHPWHVIELRPQENTVVVGMREDALHHVLRCTDLSFTSHLESDCFDAHIRVRSHGTESPATVNVAGNEATVVFQEPVWGATPGQLAVFYDGDRVIGGGTIIRVGD